MFHLKSSFDPSRVSGHHCRAGGIYLSISARRFCTCSRRGLASAPHRLYKKPGQGWPGRPGGAHSNARCNVDCSQIGIDRGLRLLTIFCPAFRSCLFVFLICVLLTKMDSSFDADGPKMHDLRIRLAISRLTCLEKTLLSRTKQETSSTAMAGLPRKKSRHHKLSIRSSGGITINLCMGFSVYGLLTPCLYS